MHMQFSHACGAIAHSPARASRSISRVSDIVTTHAYVRIHERHLVRVDAGESGSCALVPYIYVSTATRYVHSATLGGPARALDGEEATSLLARCAQAQPAAAATAAPAGAAF